MHVLLTVLHIFLLVLAGRIFLNIKTFIFGDHFLYSHDGYIWSSSDIVGRNKMLVTIGGLKQARWPPFFIIEL